MTKISSLLVIFLIFSTSGQEPETIEVSVSAEGSGSAEESESEGVTISKCCANGEVFDRSNSSCIPTNSSQSPEALFTVRQVLNLAKSENDAVNISIKNGGVQLPPCDDRLSFRLARGGRDGGVGEDAWLTVEGRLVTGAFEKEFDHGDFCLENDKSGRIVAVMCDPCHQKVCVSICCPHGQSYLDDPSYQRLDYEERYDLEPEKKCQSHDIGDWNPRFWNEQDETELERERNSHYVFKQSSGLKFQCPKDEFGQNADPLPDVFPCSAIYTNGSLRGIVTEDLCENATHQEKFEPGRFCVSYDGQQPTYYVCRYEPPPPAIKELYDWFYPVAMFISSAFLLITIMVYSVVPNLHNTLLGLMKLGYLCNMFLLYICLAINKLVNDIQETPGCIFLGYFTQYTYTAIFFWANAMALFVVIKTTNLAKMNIYHVKEQLISVLIYTQGVPLLICIITALVDAFVDNLD